MAEEIPLRLDIHWEVQDVTDWHSPSSEMGGEEKETYIDIEVL